MAALEVMQTLVREVAPRMGQADIRPDVDLGFGGYGMTIIEYLTLLDRVELRWGVRFREDAWPHTLMQIATGAGQA